jgi:hypothetical protein
MTMPHNEAMVRRKSGKKRLANDCILTKSGGVCRKRTKPQSYSQSKTRIIIGDLWIQPLNIPATITL